MKFRHLVDENNTLQCFTHGGVFHSDDVFSFALIQMYCDDFGVDFKLHRMRDEVKPDFKCLMFDYGTKYSPNEGCFNHHQEDSPKRLIYDDMEMNKSSFSLLWDYTGDHFLSGDANLHFDQGFVALIDRHDNCGGFDTLTMAIKDFNPTGLEDAGQDFEDEQFLMACKYAKMILKRKFENSLANDKGNELVFALANAEEVKESGVLCINFFSKGINKILVNNCPWVDFIVVNNIIDKTYTLVPVFVGGKNVTKIAIVKDSNALYQNETLAKFETQEQAIQCAINSIKQAL